MKNDLPKSGIYAIENTVNGKIYIGSAVNLCRRFKDHRVHLNQGKHHSLKLQRAWNKYGAAVFVFKILEAIKNHNELVLREQYWIDTLDVLGDFGYNICPVAGSCLGLKHSLERRAATSKRQKNQSKETKAKISATLMGHPVSEKTKEKLRQYKPTPEALKRAIEVNTGSKQSLETIAKRVAKLTGQKRTPKQRAKMSAWQKGKKYPDRVISDETKAKRLAARLGYKHSLETIAKLTGQKRSPESRARIVKAAKKREAARREAA